jgi:hypothetical protein
VGKPGDLTVSRLEVRTGKLTPTTFLKLSYQNLRMRPQVRSVGAGDV